MLIFWIIHVVAKLVIKVEKKDENKIDWNLWIISMRVQWHKIDAIYRNI